METCLLFAEIVVLIADVFATGSLPFATTAARIASSFALGTAFAQLDFDFDGRGRIRVVLRLAGVVAVVAFIVSIGRFGLLRLLLDASPARIEDGFQHHGILVNQGILLVVSLRVLAQQLEITLQIVQLLRGY